MNNRKKTRREESIHIDTYNICFDTIWKNEKKKYMTHTITPPPSDKMNVPIIKARVIYKKLVNGEREQKKHENNITIKICTILKKII